MRFSASISIITALTAFACTLALPRAFALPVDVPAHGSPDHKRPRTVAEQALDVIRSFSRHGKTLRRGGHCEQILVNAAERLNRPLTFLEIENSLEDILRETGESMVPVPAPTPAPSPRPSTRHQWPVCFTGSMQVLTPSGERSISELRPGDEVISFDHATSRVVTNRIAYVFPHENRAYSRLISLPRPIDVTGRHQFWASGAGLQPGYHPIEEIPHNACLMYASVNDWNSNGAVRINRGAYVSQPDLATVYDLQLIGEPRNFIVHGVLVHNVIKM